MVWVFFVTFPTENGWKGLFVIYLTKSFSLKTEIGRRNHVMKRASVTFWFGPSKHTTKSYGFTVWNSTHKSLSMSAPQITVFRFRLAEAIYANRNIEFFISSYRRPSDVKYCTVHDNDTDVARHSIKWQTSDSHYRETRFFRCRVRMPQMGFFAPWKHTGAAVGGLMV